MAPKLFEYPAGQNIRNRTGSATTYTMKMVKKPLTYRGVVLAGKAKQKQSHHRCIQHRNDILYMHLARLEKALNSEEKAGGGINEISLTSPRQL